MNRFAYYKYRRWENFEHPLRIAEQQLQETAIAQVAIFVVEYALAKLWQSWGVSPQAMIGHSIGEYVAATVAGIFSLEDGLKLVENIDKPDFEKVVNSIKYSSPQIEFISSINGKLIDSEILNPQYWCKQVSQSASFDKIIGYLKESNCDICLEVGVKSSLLELEIEKLSSTEILFLSSLSAEGNNNQDWNVILSSLAQMYISGVNIDWQGFDKGYYRNRVLLPNYPFQRQLYYVDLIGNKLKNRRDAESAEERSYRGVILHPLLGEKLDLSRSNTIYFQNYINSNNPAYLQQHQVFDKVIIPGAGYIEMALAAGSIVLKTDNLILENLEILQPLILSDDSDTTTQVVLESQQEQEYKFEILSLSTASEEWILHAKGKITRCRDVIHNVSPSVDKDAMYRVSTTMQQQLDDVLNIDDVLGKRIINVRLQNKITIREENSIAALEVMSRFAANPKWLIYLPPTMSPVETSQLPGYLEHPKGAFAYYKNQGVTEVICEEKHMGSRAVVIVCRDEEAVKRKFGIVNEGIGICYTRTGRRFFNNLELEAEFLQRTNRALCDSDFWSKLNTDWVCLDCELMPWSAKAQGLIRSQYAAVGAASRPALSNAINLLTQASQNGVEVNSLLDKFQERQEMANQYVDAYRRYCWEVNDISDIKLAPFHILATEGAVHIDKNHSWHMEQAAILETANPQLLMSTNYKIIDLNDPSSEAEGTHWWEEMTSKGGEGMVVKPLEFIVKGKRGILQPAVKCRGKEYLRIIYGAEYTTEENLERLRKRGLSLKRSLAMREFALGVEALERFVADSPLRRVHECVFGVLALESEAVDPRL